jgi:hypothetical protein
MSRPVVAYLQERFPFRVFGPATLLLLALAALSIEAPQPGRGLVMAVLVVLLVLQFRLWDDLEDRDRDARDHPERVIVRLPPGQFWQALAVLSFVNIGLALASRERWALIGLLALDVAAVAAYRWLRAYVGEALWSRGILLAKYPAIVAIAALAGGTVSRPRLAAACLAAFAIAHVYERAHTRAELPGASR